MLNPQSTLIFNHGYRVGAGRVTARLAQVRADSARVLVVQSHDESERDLVVFQVMQKGTAERRIVQWPARCVHHETRLRIVGRDLPQLFQSDRIALRVPSLREVKFSITCFPKWPRAPSAKTVYLPKIVVKVARHKPIGRAVGSSSIARGSMTAPERMWAPGSDPFSNTTTLSSFRRSIESCLSRIAVANPAAPAPTMTRRIPSIRGVRDARATAEMSLVFLCGDHDQVTTAANM